MSDTTPRGICRVRILDPREKTYGPYPDAARFVIECRICPANGIFAGIFAGVIHTLGWTSDLPSASEFARAHTDIHLDRQCGTCKHIPTAPVSVRDTQALWATRRAMGTP